METDATVAAPSAEPTPAPMAAPSPAAEPSASRPPRGAERSSGNMVLGLVVAAIAVLVAGTYLFDWPNPLQLIVGIGEWQALTPEFVILLFALLVPLVGLWDADRAGLQQFAFIAVAGSFLLTLGSLFGFDSPLPFTNIRFTLEYVGVNLNGVYAITYASQLLKLLFLGVALLAIVGIGRPLKGRSEEDYGEFYSLLLFATLGMMVVASAQELFTLFLGIEMTSMASYLLAAFRRDRIASEAGLKYFVIGAISSGLTLFAISLLYGMAGTTSIPGLGDALRSGGGFDAIAIVPIVLLLAGLGFKVSAVPFHAWAPDVYSGAPVPVAGVLASASKAMGFIAIFQVFLVGLIGLRSDWQLAVAIVAVVTMTVGNLVAVQQTNLRRMLAYSSIAQAGYLLIAVAVGTWFAVGGGIFHLFTNAAMKLGAFLVVGALLYAGIPDHVDGWRGLGKRAPLLAFAMTVFLLSMAGLPPFGGFASKFVLFSGAIDAGVSDGVGWLVWLAVAAVVNSAISLYYYLRVIRSMYVEAPESGGEGVAVEQVVVPAGTTVAVAICLALVLVMGLFPQPFVDAAMKAAQGLLGITA